MATAKIIELDESNTCKICDNALAKYSCPKCNILYCSLTCYQAVSHLECSESFYKENVMNELQMGDNTEMKNKMLEILQRLHESNRIANSEEDVEVEEEQVEYLNFDNDFNFENLDSDDDDDYQNITDRLAGVNLDNTEEVWEKLTEDEKQDFVAFLKSEDVTKLIPAWKPWWEYYKDDKVEDLSQSEDYKNTCPVLFNITNFAEITKTTPSDSVKHNLINIISSYAFTARYFNGEHFEFAQEAVNSMISISLTLKTAQNFEDFETAVKSVEQECINSDWIITDAENIQTMRIDLDKILRGPKPSDNKFYILCALSDIHRLFNTALLPVEGPSKSAFQKKFLSDHFPAVQLENLDNVKTLIKKIEYYLSYTKDCYLA